MKPTFTWPNSHEFLLRARADPMNLLISLLPALECIVSFCLFVEGRGFAHKQDICQEIVLFLVENDFHRLRSYDCQQSSPRTWLTVLIQRRIHRLLRRLPPQTGKLSDNHLAYNCSPEDALIKAEEEMQLTAAVSSLKPQDRTFFEVFEQCDFRESEVSTRLGIKISTSYLRKHRVFRRIKESIAAHLHAERERERERIRPKMRKDPRRTSQLRSK